MIVHTLARTQLLDGEPDDVFPFFADAGNLEAITPPLLGFKVTTARPIAMHAGALIDYRLRVHRVPIGWRTQIESWDPPHTFVDTQLRGPYKLWHHTHTFEPRGSGQTLMTDTVRYAIGFGLLGRLAHKLFVQKDIEAIFNHRARVIPTLLARDNPGTT